MSRGWYGITGTGNDMLNRYREQECISQYIRSKTKIKQQIDEIQNREPRHFCSRCSAIKEHIHAENNRINKCYLSNSKSLKLVDDDDIKRFIAECIEYHKCVLNRTRPAKKTVTSGRGSVGKAKQQLGGDSNTSKPGDSPIKGPQRQDQNRAGGKVLTEAKSVAQKPDGISSPHNSVEAQEEASKQIVNPPSSTSGRTDTQAQKISQSAHPPVSKTDPHPSGSIEGTPNGENQLLKSTQLMGLRISTSQSDSPNGQIAAGQIVKNQDPGDGVSVTEISNTEDHAVQGVGTDICSNAPDGKESCDKIAVIRDPAIVPSVDVSIVLDFNLDEYPCSEDDILELFGSETVRGEARGREASSIKVTGNEENGDVLNAVMLNTSTDKDTEVAVLTHSHKFHVTEGVSDLNMCQPTSDMVSTPRCVPSNRAAESAFSLQKVILTEEEKNDDQVSSRPSSHQVDQLNQQNFAQQDRKLHYEQESSLPEDERLGVATSNGEEYLNNPDTTNIIHLIEYYKKYIISGLLPLVIFLLLFLLIKCTPLGTIFTKKKGRKRKKMNEKIQRVLSEPSATREGRIPFSYSAFEYSS